MRLSIVVYGKSNCIWCERVQELLSEKGYYFDYKNIEIPLYLEEYIKYFPGKKTVPQVAEVTTGISGKEFLNLIGGYEDTYNWLNK